MAVIKMEKSKALAALTAAALSLPGLNASAATPVTRAEANFQYGHYQESAKRMKVQVYHTDTLIPLSDRLEFSFSYDRDTYSGASPAYSVPDVMTTSGDPGAWWAANGATAIYGWQRNKPAPDPLEKYPQNIDPSGLDWNEAGYYKADAISSASQVTAEGLTAGSLEQYEVWNELNVLNGENREARIAAYRTMLNIPLPNNAPIKQVFQNQPLETRTQPTLGLKYYFDNTTLGISGGMSDEPDYLSNFGSVNLSQELNNKMTTVSVGYGATSNSIWRNTGHSHAPALANSDKLPHIPASDCVAPATVCAPGSALDGSSLFNAFNLGFSQVLSKTTLLNAFASYTNQSGYLSNPYKAVYVRGEITPEEYVAISEAAFLGNKQFDWNSITQLQIVGPELFREIRPDHRNQLSLGTGLIQHIPMLDASAHLDYRFYTDDWQVNSHTFEFKWFQPLPYGIMAAPSVRYYSQSQAEFFAPYFLAPRADGHYSSDFRLSGFGSLNGGITLSKEFAKGINIEAGIEYYTHQGGLKMGGGGSGDYADYSSYLAHGGIKIDLSAPGLLGGGSGHEHHHHHMHHGSQPPAGVMYGHMMPKANDVMVGYRYMYGSQGGDMLNGSQPVSDQTVNALGCPGYSPAAPLFTGCLVKPASMTMGMHMFDLMYAPTDWLNLMVMPQLMDMEMTMSKDLREPYKGHVQNAEQHYSSDTQSSYSGMQHDVFDLGDTIATVLIKVYNDPNHHVHVGIGGSAPTGSVSEIHGQTPGVVYPNNIPVLQDIGMQAGSGTWDFKPSATYTGQMNDVYWGAQFNATVRLQDKNKSGYALGDVFQSTSWLGYNLFNWLSASVRGQYTDQGKIIGQMVQYSKAGELSGESQQAHSTSSTVDYEVNYGGQYWDVGFGLNATVTGGDFTGHTFSFEWLQPVNDKVNGYQLARDGALSATWSYMF
ncbi:MAG: DUF3570 domain-containing protein [Methylococcaceae bacterium]